MALSAIFDIGKTGVLTYQKALQIASHNVANAATEGYTRQEPVFFNIGSGLASTQGIPGRGVRFADIRRVYDAFLEHQVKVESSNFAYWDIIYNGQVKLESIFNEASEQALSRAINAFFNAWQELSQNPNGTAERSLLLDKADFLAKRINYDYKSILSQRDEFYVDAQNIVHQINTLIDKINQINEKIAASPGALDLKDQRENLITQLNDLVKINYFEDVAGRYSVLLYGMPLVDGGKVYHLSLGLDDRFNIRVSLETETGQLIDITNRVEGGKLKATIDLRDRILPEYMNRLNMFVFDLTEAVNALHRRGYGLDGSTGNNFFTQLYSISVNSPAPPATPYEDLTAKINSLSRNTYDEYRITFDGNNWTVQNLTNPSQNVSVSVTPWNEAGVNFFRLSFNGIELTFREPNGNLSLNFQVNPQAGLLFSVAITDTNRIAAAQANPNLQGSGVFDNRTARAIYSLINSPIIGNSTPIDYYRTIVSEVGVLSNSAKIQRSFQEAMVEELNRRRQELSGVSLDEEAINLVKFQKMYEASARVIRVADEILTTLFEMTR